MAKWLDQQVDRLEEFVEKHFRRCGVTFSGSRCILPRDHASTEPHTFLLTFLETRIAAEGVRADVQTCPDDNGGQAPGRATPRRRWGDSQVSEPQTRDTVRSVAVSFASTHNLFHPG